MRRLAIVVALLVPASASASDGALLAAQQRYLPAAAAAYGSTPDGAQARYDAGRNLTEGVLAAGRVSDARRALRVRLLALGRAQVARAEALDRADGFRSAAPLAPLPAAAPGYGLRRPDATLARRLAAVAAGVNGAVGIWVHELDSGRYAGFQQDARFAAASTVKLGVLAAGLRASPRPERSRWWYDVRQIGFWSSNLAANRIAAGLGYGAVTEGLHRLGMTSSTYPGPYRATTSWKPPGAHTRVTTARDLGRALYRLHAGAHGSGGALAQLGLSRRQAILALRVLASAQGVGDNAGLLRPSLPGLIVAEKNGWLSDTRTTASIVYRGGRATIVVVELYRPGVTYREGKQLGRRVLQAAGLVR
ncbi:MAG TPA: serine hydrolase [Gaiellaceae bacterium]|nr:serine hydrolase [Gaiellaceae bacterium]